MHERINIIRLKELKFHPTTELNYMFALKELEGIEMGGLVLRTHLDGYLGSKRQMGKSRKEMV